MEHKNSKSGEMEMTTKPKCIICKQERSSFFKNFGKWRLFKCENDGLIFVHPKPTRKELWAFYNSGEYFHSKIRKFGYSDYLREKKVLNLNNKNILQKIKYFLFKLNPTPESDNPYRLLDIGAAYGFFLEIARAENFEIYGNDISEEAVSHARARGLNMSLGSTKDQNYLPDFFDVVTILGVIEHFEDPKEEMAEAVRVLKPGGLMVILASDMSQFMGHGAIKPPEHLYYFSRKNFSQFLSLYNFKIIRTYKFFNFYGYGELIYRFLGRFFKQGKFADRIEKFLFSAILILRLNKILDRMPLPIPDGQILVIAQKQR